MSDLKLLSFLYWNGASCHSVNAHAEELRDRFVAHEGKKELVVRTAGSRYTADFGNVARQMTELIDQNVSPL